MHRVGCILLFLSLLVPVFADVYSSNELFQRLAVKDGLSSLGWELEALADREVLYFDGVIKGEKILHPDGYEKIWDEQSERVFLDSNGNVVRRILKDGEKIEEYNYFYKEGSLASYTYSMDDNLIKKIDYIDADGRLVAISGDKNAYLTRDSIVYRDNEGKAVAITTFDLKTVDDSNVLDSSGSFSELVDGVLYTYASNGRLEFEEGDGFSVHYNYSEDGSLVSIDTIQGDLKIVDEYVNSIKVKTMEYEAGITRKVRTYLDGGVVEEIRYLSGKPRYRMIFDMDGKRLKEVLPL